MAVKLNASSFGEYHKGEEPRARMSRLDPRLAQPVLTWNIPAYMTWYAIRHFPNKFLTCPNADKCAVGCYARFGQWKIGDAPIKHHQNLSLTRDPGFEDAIVAALSKRHFFRIHSAGDFYDPEYQLLWYRIIARLPNTLFWAYTKMVSQSRKLEAQKPGNLNLIFSEGGTEDSQILESDRIASVFPMGTGREEMALKGYDYCMDDDLVPICLNGVKRVGLAYHQPQGSKEWHTRNCPLNKRRVS